jgi:hypothetical protein
MSMTRKQEERLLTTDENDLVAQSHQPALSELPDDEVAKIEKLLRERRDRAQALANKARREMRGKKRSASPPSDDTGSKLKAAALAAAVQRVNKERSRRRVNAAREEMIANARRALELRQASGEAASRPGSRTAGKGMKRIQNKRAERLGSPMEAGRVSQFVKTSQAKRDSR